MTKVYQSIYLANGQLGVQTRLSNDGMQWGYQWGAGKFLAVLAVLGPFPASNLQYQEEPSPSGVKPGLLGIKVDV